MRTQRTAISQPKCSTKCGYRFAILHIELVVSGALVFNGFAIRYYEINKLFLLLYSSLSNAYLIPKSPLSIRPSACTHKTRQSLYHFHKICYWKTLLKIYLAVSIFFYVRGRHMPISKSYIFRHTRN